VPPKREKRLRFALLGAIRRARFAGFSPSTHAFDMRPRSSATSVLSGPSAADLAQTSSPAAGSTTASAFDAQAILAAMVGEMTRSKAGLRIPGSPRPYHILYSLRRTEAVVLRAAYGSLVRDRTGRQGALYVEVRVGNHHFDNVMDGGLDQRAEERESAEWVDAPDDLDPLALRVALWKLTQIKFDEALEDYFDHRKALVSEYLRDEIASLSREPALVVTESIDVDALPVDSWRERLRTASKKFLAHADIFDPGVQLRVERIHRWLVNTDGTRVITQDIYVEAVVEGWVLNRHGVYLESVRTLRRRYLDGVPSLAELEALVDEVLHELGELREAESLGSFVGPALLSGQAASTMFHEALGHRLEGERLVARGETRTFAHKVGEPILPAGLNVYDDPQAVDDNGQSMWGSYRVDDEGVRARRADLVKDGVLVGFLTSRQPSKQTEQSNGHARHDGLQRPMARMGNLIVQADPDRCESWENLEDKLLELARKQGRPQALIISRILSGETTTSSYDFQVFKGELSEVYVVDVATRARRRVQDVELIGTPLAALQRVVAFGGSDGCDDGYCYAESGSVPVGGRAPAILLGEVELQQRSTSGHHDSLLPPPFSDDGSSGRQGGLRGRGRRKPPIEAKP
jgi:hypothetical protein